jgi:hypothetical protein
MDEQFVFQDNPVFLIVLIGVFAVFALVASLISALIFCRIFSKAGYHWALGLLTLVPVINMLMPFFLAFADWPAQKELRELRQRLGIAPDQGVSGNRQS